MAPVYRVTLFKIPSEEDQLKLLEMYKQMPAKAVKDGKPYVKSVKAGQTYSDQRNQGYTIAVTTEFESMEGFEYYDKECPAHAELKQFAGSVHQGVLMLFYSSVTS